VWTKRGLPGCQCNMGCGQTCDDWCLRRGGGDGGRAVGLLEPTLPLTDRTNQE
jgi:hypothetical protein